MQGRLITFFYQKYLRYLVSWNSMSCSFLLSYITTCKCITDFLFVIRRIKTENVGDFPHGLPWIQMSNKLLQRDVHSLKWTEKLLWRFVFFFSTQMYFLYRSDFMLPFMGVILITMLIAAPIGLGRQVIF